MPVPSSLIRVPVEMPNRSGHNLSHSNSFTGKTGTLIPVLCEELLPNDTVSLGSQLQVQLPPMVTDFYGKVDFVLEAFFCPNRLCWGGWQDFITHPTANPQYPEGTPVQDKPKSVPYFLSTINANNPDGYFEIAPDSLLHYLDYGSRISNESGASVLKAIAYHRIWDDWYRDSRIQAPLFYRPSRGPSSGIANTSSILPYISLTTGGSGSSIGDTVVYLGAIPDGGSTADISARTFSDGVTIDQLRQRNWVKDYFTSASLLPQAGGASEVKFDIDSINETGAFSIATLRSSNALQIWLERNNLAGYRYSDQIYAQFGCYPADAIMDRPLYLGRTVQTVYNRSVFNTTSDELAVKGANSQVIGEGSIVDSFTATEHGFLMVLASLVPRPVYGSGAERSSFRIKVGDFAFPLLAGMGDQEILKRELTGRDNDTAVFGYTDLYAEYKFRNDKVHGLLRDGYSLDKFVLQRSFDDAGSADLGSDFLLIPTDYLDQVQAVATSEVGYTYWAEIYFPFKKLSTIPAYSQPTLADLKHAHTEYISRGGKRL